MAIVKWPRSHLNTLNFLAQPLYCTIFGLHFINPAASKTCNCLRISGKGEGLWILGRRTINAHFMSRVCSEIASCHKLINRSQQATTDIHKCRTTTKNYHWRYWITISLINRGCGVVGLFKSIGIWFLLGDFSVICCTRIVCVCVSVYLSVCVCLCWVYVPVLNDNDIFSKQCRDTWVDSPNLILM